MGSIIDIRKSLLADGGERKVNEIMKTNNILIFLK